MDTKQAWLQLVQEKSDHYLNLHDGGFDEKMQARLVACDYEATRGAEECLSMLSGALRSK